MNGLSFLEPTNLGKALKRWRDWKKKRPTDVAKKSRELGMSFPSQEVSKFEKGDGFSIERLVTRIFPAYGICDAADFDLFIDFAQDFTLDDVVVITKFSELNIAVGTELWVAPAEVGINRSRISILNINPGRATKWQWHEGHEFVMVSAGRVRAEFALAEQGERKKVELKKGQGVAFPSLFYHSFINLATDSAAQITIARPTKSLPNGMRNLDAD